MVNGVATLEDVAKLAGVSKSTASRILAARKDQKLPFALATQEKVRHAAVMLGYRPSKLARGLTQSKKGMIGLAVPSIESAFYLSVTAAVESRLSDKGYSVILSSTRSDSRIERAKVDDLMAWPVDGLVIVPSQETGDAGLFWELWQRNTPFVLVDRTFSDVPFYSVTTDDYGGATAAVEHLVSTGRRRIARAGGPLTMYTSRLRHLGYLESLIHNGILPDPKLSVEVAATLEGGRLAAERLMDLTPPPDAVFCFGDMIAIGVMEFCFEHGIRIPQELAVVGYGDLDLSNLLKVPLTTIHQPRTQLGQCAADMLLAQLEGRVPEEPQQKLPVELVIRESTAPAADLPH